MTKGTTLSRFRQVACNARPGSHRSEGCSLRGGRPLYRPPGRALPGPATRRWRPEAHLLPQQDHLAQVVRVVLSHVHERVTDRVISERREFNGRCNRLIESIAKRSGALQPGQKRRMNVGPRSGCHSGPSVRRRGRNWSMDSPRIAGRTNTAGTPCARRSPRRNVARPNRGVPPPPRPGVRGPLQAECVEGCRSAARKHSPHYSIFWPCAPPATGRR